MRHYDIQADKMLQPTAVR